MYSPCRGVMKVANMAVAFVPVTMVTVTAVVVSGMQINSSFMIAMPHRYAASKIVFLMRITISITALL